MAPNSAGEPLRLTTPGRRKAAMADEVKRVQYYYTEIPDKPGEGLKVLTALREEGVNLDAFVAFPKGRRTQLDFVPMNQADFKAAAKKAKVRADRSENGFSCSGR